MLWKELVVTTPQELLRLGRQVPRAVVAVNGCFNGLHDGHRRLLGVAQRLGSPFVLLNSDASIARRKPGSIVIPWERRASEIAATWCAFRIIQFDTEEQLEDWLQVLAPDYMVKGSDYLGKPITGSKYVRQMVYIERGPESSTANQLMA